MGKPYVHPGQSFLSRHGKLRSGEDLYGLVDRYVDFLRQESGLSDAPPIDLAQIYQHFGIPTPIRAPLDEQQGILVDSRTGIILIRENDPIVRQRFTEGHELMELLFDACTDQSSNWNEAQKERMCDRGAANLLMPQSTFMPLLTELGMSLTTGKAIATLYQTSLIATLIRIIHLTPTDHALILWHYANKPSEVNSTATHKPIPRKKLRIWWRTQSPQWSGGFIPKAKSVEAGSLIAQAHLSGQHLQGEEIIHLGPRTLRCQLEAMPLQMGDKACVVSFINP
jgi:Zn-dependent peptidase ImmA (M78 family)